MRVLAQRTCERIHVSVAEPAFGRVQMYRLAKVEMLGGFKAGWEADALKGAKWRGQLKGVSGGPREEKVVNARKQRDGIVEATIALRREGYSDAKIARVLAKNLPVVPKTVREIIRKHVPARDQVSN